MVCDAISMYEENRWKGRLLLREDLVRYRSTHSKLKLHILWRLALAYPHLRYCVQYSLKIASRPITSCECPKCGRHAFDYDRHVLLHCEYYITERNEFFSTLIDQLDVDSYVQIEFLDENEMLALFWGSAQTLPGIVSQTTWENVSLSFCKYVFHLKNVLDNPLFSVQQ